VTGLPGEVEVGGGVLEPQRQRLCEPAARVGGAEQEVGDRAAAGLSRQPALEHGAGVPFPVRQPHRRAVGEHDDEPPVRAREPRQQRDLARRQVDVGPVEALGLVGAGQAEERHDGARALRQRDRLGGERVVVRGRADAEAGGELDRDAVR
jgi:hypothetical protein